MIITDAAAPPAGAVASPTVTVTVTATTTAPAQPSPKAPDTSNAIVIAACIALAGVVATVVVQSVFGRRTARSSDRAATAAERSASAAQQSADASTDQVANAQAAASSSEKSAQAAHDAVAVGRVQAVGELIALLGSGDGRQAEAAMLAMKDVDDGLARRIAGVCSEKGAIGALSSLAGNSEPVIRDAARKSLEVLLDNVWSGIAFMMRSSFPSADASVFGLGVVVAPTLVVTPSYMIRELRTPLEAIFSDGTTATLRVLEYGTDYEPVAVLELTDFSHPEPLSLSEGAAAIAFDPVTVVTVDRDRISGGPTLMIETSNVVGLREGGGLLLDGAWFGPRYAGAPVLDRDGALLGITYNLETDPQRSNQRHRAEAIGLAAISAAVAPFLPKSVD